MAFFLPDYRRDTGGTLPENKPPQLPTGSEIVKTAAGEFQATRVRVQCRFQKHPQQSNFSTLFLDAWYVPQIGRVIRIDKRVPPASPDDLGEERESYQLKRGPLTL